MRASNRSTTRWLTLLVLCAAQFLLIVDVVIVNVALPTIRTALTIPDAQLPLVSIAYTLTFGSLLIVAGRAGDLFGRRRLLILGLLIFTVASCLSGAAQEGWQLLTARALQGLGAALIAPTTLALVTATFADGPERNRALGFWGAVGSGGAIAGQLLGGVITDLFGWRWIFLINVPLGILGIVLASLVIADAGSTSPSTRSRLDVRGALTLAAGLAMVSIALARLAEAGVDFGFGTSALVGAALLASFVWLERRHPAPLVRFGLLRAPGVWSGNLVLALLAGSLGAALYYTTLYLQVVLGYSPLQVGAAFAPLTLIVLVVSPRAGQWASRFGVRQWLILGTSLTALGLLLLTGIEVGGSYLAHVLPGLALVALGNGLAFAPTMIAATHGVAEREQGLASGLLNTAQELGSALGLGLLATLAATVARVGAGSADADALVVGYRVGFVAAAVLVGFAVCVSSTLPRALGQATERAPAAAA